MLLIVEDNGVPDCKITVISPVPPVAPVKLNELKLLLEILVAQVTEPPEQLTPLTLADVVAAERVVAIVLPLIFKVVNIAPVLEIE